MSADKKADPNEPVTSGLLDEAVDSILKGIDKLVNSAKEELRQEMKAGFEEAIVERRGLRREIRDLQWDTPTTKEFNKLKARVNNLEKQVRTPN